MALNLTNLFTAIGRAGRTAYLIATGQQPQSVPFNELAGFAYVKPAWIATLASSYDANIRIETAPMTAWAQAAQTILQQFVAADDPTYGVNLSSSLTYLQQQMVAQSATVARCTVGSTVTPDAANVGKGVVFVTLTRGDGVPLEHTVAETSTLLITADSFTGNATAGREPWSWAGAPNNSSLGTGVSVGKWDWDWPQGSAAGASGFCISAADQANPAGNMTANGNFESWSGSPAVPASWHLVTGAWGTSIQQGATAISGSSSVQFKAGGTLNQLTQQFNSSVTDSTNVAAGTTAPVIPYTGFFFNAWFRASGTITGGVMTFELVDGSGTVITDQAGTPNSATLTLSTIVSTGWTAKGVAFRLPVVLPAVVRLQVRISTALAGADLFMDDVCFTKPTNLYLGGPNIAVFSNAASPFEAAPDPDGFTLTFTNDRAGSTFCATFQTLFLRLFGTPALLMPSTTSPPTLPDTLITGV